MGIIKPEKEMIIAEILDEIDFGVTSGECKSKICEKWRIAERTFDRYWGEASKRYKARLDAIEEATTKAAVSMEIKALKKAILSKHERQEILTQIAKGEIPLVKHIVCDGVIHEVDVVPAWADRRAAIAELNKMDGDYAPVKKDITSGGEPIKQITGIIVE